MERRRDDQKALKVALPGNFQRKVRILIRRIAGSFFDEIPSALVLSGEPISHHSRLGLVCPSAAENQIVTDVSAMKGQCQVEAVLQNHSRTIIAWLARQGESEHYNSIVLL